MPDPDPPSSARCPECGTALSSTRVEGLCPVCLLEDTAVPLPDERPPELAAPPPPKTGPGLLQLPGYHLTREIARGGMGIIYEATQLNPSRTVAIKMLLPHLMEEPAMRERFRREAQAMAGLDHAGILPVYEVGDYNGLPYFSMKLAPGGTLGEQEWRFRGNWRATAELIAGLADAIQTAHTHGVLHRDLKPANILFDEQNRAYISDFGIAKQLAGDASGFDLTLTSTLLGTPNYLPPEWASGAARGHTTSGDLYGLGAILYQLLTGDPPHRAAQLTTLLRQIADDAVVSPRGVNPAIPGDLEIICLKSIAKDPSRRYASAADLAQDLRLWLAGRPIRARAASVGEKAWRWARRNPLAAGLAALLAGFLIVGGSALWMSLQASRQNLHDSLIAQASAIRETARLGNRTRAIDVLEQARDLDPSNAVRLELTSALAMTDMQEMQRFTHGTGTRVHTDAACTRYSSINPNGRVTVRSLKDQSIISTVPGDITDPEGYGPFSPDGRFLGVRPKRNEPFSVWDCQDHVFRQREVAGFSLLFAPDSRTMVIGKHDGTLVVMDVITGAIHATYPTDLSPIRPHSFSPDGTRLIAAEYKKTRFIVIEVATGRTVLRGEHPKAGNVRCAVWRPNGSGFFIGTESFKIYEWSFSDNSLPRQYVGHQGNVFALAVHPGGELLLSQAEDGTTRLWNTASSQTLAELPYFGSEVRFSPDGRQFLCEDRDAYQLHLVNLSPSLVCRQFPVPHPDPDRIGTRGCWAITFSPDGGLLSVGDTAGMLHYDGYSGEAKGHHSINYCWSLGWAPDGSALYSASKSGLQYWAIGSPGNSPPDAAAAAAGGPGPRTLLPPVQWEVERPDPDDPSASINHVAVSDNHSAIALAYEDRIGLFTRRDWQNPVKLGRVEPLLDAIAINHDATLVAASQKNAPGIPIWNAKSRERINLLQTRFAEATVCFHPDGVRLFSGDLESLTCWNARTGAVLWRIPCPARASVAVQTALTPDGTLLACSLTPDTIYIIDPANGREITRLRHPSPHRIASLAFSPDHSRLAAFCMGHLVQLWDLKRLREELAARALDWPHIPLPPPRKPYTWSLPFE